MFYFLKYFILYLYIFQHITLVSTTFWCRNRVAKIRFFCEYFKSFVFITSISHRHLIVNHRFNIVYTLFDWIIVYHLLFWVFIAAVPQRRCAAHGRYVLWRRSGSSRFLSFRWSARGPRNPHGLRCFSCNTPVVPNGCRYIVRCR